VTLRDAAIATSGIYARGNHLVDPRSGRPSSGLLSATATARDAVTANALATAACVLGAEAGLRVVDRTPGAEALLVTSSGVVLRSSGFARLERAPVTGVVAAGAWPDGYQLTMSLTVLQTTGRGAVHRPYVGVWAEDASNKLVRVLAFWANEPKYYGELSILFNRAGRNPDRLHTLARATRSPGKYDLVWDGLDDQRAAVPAGPYKIVIETNQEGGSYAKQSGVITCGDDPADLMLSGSVNVEPIAIRYGPKRGA
jgi:thiamine biosynthesis lipoprotein